jgi:uncharacterized protein YxjI
MRYLVQERVFSFTADFWIEDENGERVFFVDGKALSLRETFELRDASGNIRALIRKKLFAMRDTMDIEGRDGVIATVRPAFFSPIRHRYEVTLADGSRLEATGNFTDKDWELTGDGRLVGRISRQWFRIRDTYGVEVGPGEDDALVIAIAVCIDRIHEDEERKHHQQSPFGGGFGRLPVAGARHSTTSVIAFASSGSRSMLAARMFSSTCSGEPEPGIGRICGDLDSSQAIAT